MNKKTSTKAAAPKVALTETQTAFLNRAAQAIRDRKPTTAQINYANQRILGRFFGSL